MIGGYGCFSVWLHFLRPYEDPIIRRYLRGVFFYKTDSPVTSRDLLLGILRESQLPACRLHVLLDEISNATGTSPLWLNTGIGKGRAPTFLAPSRYYTIAINKHTYRTLHNDRISHSQVQFHSLHPCEPSSHVSLATRQSQSSQDNQPTHPDHSPCPQQFTPQTPLRQQKNNSSHNNNPKHPATMRLKPP